jgi:hypothetical protein
METSTTIPVYVLNGVAYCNRCIVRATCAFHDIPDTILREAGYGHDTPAEYVLAFLFRGNISTLRGPLTPAMCPARVSRSASGDACRHLTVVGVPR